MAMLDIVKISVAGNPRKDFGDLTELTASIKEKGVLQPLIVRKTESGVELIAGERRLKASKAAGLTQVPVVFMEGQDDSSIEEIKLIENIQRKDLSPIEEADAFQGYMNRTKHGFGYLAKKLGKTSDYIQRRLALNNLIPSVQKALKNKKIKLGHAVIIARYDKKEQVELLEDAERTETVGGFLWELEGDRTSNLDSAPFDKNTGPDGNNFGNTGCKNCTYNGGSQILLTDLGGEDMKGSCMKPSCYHKRTKKWLDEEAEKLKKKGINVIPLEKIKEITGAKQLWSYEDEYKKAVNNLEKKPDVYAVTFDGTKKLIWKIGHNKKKDPKKIQEEAEEKLNMTRKEKLKHRVSDFRRKLLLEQTRQLFKTGKEMKAIAVWNFLNEHICYEQADEIKNFLKITNHDKLPKLFNMDDKKLDEAMKIMAKYYIHTSDSDELKVMSKQFGFDYTKHFTITKEYVDLYTKDQLMALMKELKIGDMKSEEFKKLKKAQEIKDYILKNAKQGMVPKILEVK